jgi:hypothetical protein
MVATRLVDPLLPYGWVVRFGYASIPVFVFGQTLLTVDDAALPALRPLYELPVAFALPPSRTRWKLASSGGSVVSKSDDEVSLTLPTSRSSFPPGTAGPAWSPVSVLANDGPAVDLNVVDQSGDRTEQAVAALVVPRTRPVSRREQRSPPHGIWA